MKWSIVAVAILLPLVLAALASPVSAAVARPTRLPAEGLVESGLVPMAGVVVGTLMIAGGLWSPRRDRRS